MRVGFDLMEFVLSVEDAFALRFPDQSRATITTPRRLIDYLAAQLPVADEHYCLTQRAYYRLRQILVRRLGCSRSALRPRTSLLAAIPEEARAAVWMQVRRDIGAGYARYWPRLGVAGRFEHRDCPPVGCLRDAACFLVARLPLILKIPGEGWTRMQVAEVVQGLIWEEFGLRRNQYHEDSCWDQDMGIA